MIIHIFEEGSDKQSHPADIDLNFISFILCIKFVLYLSYEIFPSEKSTSIHQ